MFGVLNDGEAHEPNQRMFKTTRPDFLRSEDN